MSYGQGRPAMDYYWMNRSSNISAIRLLTKSACTTSNPRVLERADPSCGGGGRSSSKHQISYKPYVAPCYKDHDAKNMEKNRPMSPHLLIYAPTLPSMTSIMQRISGSILSFYALLISGSMLFLSNGIDSMVSMIQSLDLSRPVLFVFKILIGLPFSYHYFCGIRFCAFNAGKWLDMKTVYSTAKQGVILAAAVALFFALL